MDADRINYWSGFVRLSLIYLNDAMKDFVSQARSREDFLSDDDYKEIISRLVNAKNEVEIARNKALYDESGLLRGPRQ